MTKTQLAEDISNSLWPLEALNGAILFDQDLELFASTISK